MNKKTLEMIIVAIIVIALVIMVHLGITHLWNTLMPKIFGLPTIDGWDLFGLMLILRWIFPRNYTISKEK